jgi:hypothetical protein
MKYGYPIISAELIDILLQLPYVLSVICSIHYLLKPDFQ